MENLPDLIIPFKRKVYERVVKEFAKFAKSRSAMSGACGAAAEPSDGPQPRILQRALSSDEAAAARAVSRRAWPCPCGVGHVLLQVLDLAGQHVAVEILDRHRDVGEHGQALRTDLGEAADATTSDARRRRRW